MEQELKELIKGKREASNGSNGHSLPELLSLLNCDSEDLKTELNKLHAEKLIRIRLGINGRLIFATEKLLKE